MFTWVCWDDEQWHALQSKFLLLFQGEHIGTTEATETFFAMTKLFQSKDVSKKLYFFATNYKFHCK